MQRRSKQSRNGASKHQTLSGYHSPSFNNQMNKQANNSSNKSLKHAPLQKPRRTFGVGLQQLRNQSSESDMLARRPESNGRGFNRQMQKELLPIDEDDDLGGNSWAEV